MKNLKIDNLNQISEYDCIANDYLQFNTRIGKLKDEDRSRLSNYKKQEYSDTFYDYLKSIINKSDFVIFSSYPQSEIESYKKILNFSEYTTNVDYRLRYLDNNGYVFDIKNSEDKETLINNLKFNLEEYEDGWPDFDLHVKIIDIDREYVANDESYNHSEYMYLIKDDKVIASLARRDGCINDYVNLIDDYCENYKKTR